MAHRPGWVAKTQRCQTFSSGLRGQPGFSAAEPGSRNQQGSVEEPLMDSAHLTSLLLPLRDHRRCRVTAMADRPPEPAQIRLIGGHQMSSPQPEELDPVLEGTQQPI